MNAKSKRFSFAQLGLISILMIERRVLISLMAIFMTSKLARTFLSDKKKEESKKRKSWGDQIIGKCD